MARKLALVIGNSEYQDAGLAQLKAPDADVRALTDLLRQPDIGQFDDVVPLVNASEAVTRRAIASLFARANPDDLLLLYFSGHGVLDEQGRLYLAAHDTQRDLLQATAISTAFVTDAMDSSRSRRQVLILDCCHSGAFGRGARAATDAKAVTQATFEGIGWGRAVLTATDATQYAWEGESVIGAAENSVFTHFMIEGLSSGAADTDNDGDITLEELYTYIYGEVVKLTPKQTPRKWSYNQQGEFLIARNTQPRVTKPLHLPPDLQQSVDDLRPWVREGSVHELERLLFGAVPGLALAAQAALSKLKDDDSHRVALAAAGALDRYAAQRGAPASAKPATAPPAVSQPAATPEPVGSVAAPSEPAALPAMREPALFPATPTEAAPSAAAEAEAALPLPARQTVEPVPLEPQPAELAALAAESEPAESPSNAAPAVTLAASPGPATSLAPQAAALLQALWPPVLVIASGWALSRAAAQMILSENMDPAALVWFLNWVVGGAAGGLVTGLVLQRLTPSFGQRQIGLLVGAWAAAWAISWMLIQSLASFLSNFGVTADLELLSHISQAVGGALGGFGLAAILRPVVPSLRARQIRIITIGWAVGWALADVLATWIHNASNWQLGWLVGGLAGGLIGGAATVWQLRDAQQEPGIPMPVAAAAPSPRLTATDLWRSVALTGLGWGLAQVTGTLLAVILDTWANSVWAHGIGTELFDLVAWVLGVAIAGTLTGLVLRRVWPSFDGRQIWSLAAASAAGSALGWMTATSVQTFGEGFSLAVSRPVAMSLGGVVGGAVGGYAVAASCGALLAAWRPGQTWLVLGGWACGLGLAFFLGSALSEALDLSNLLGLVTYFGLVGLAAGLLVGAVTFWPLARLSAPPPAAA